MIASGATSGAGRGARPSRTIITGAFVALLVLLAIVAGSALFLERRSNAEIDSIVGNAVRSIVLVRRIGLDVERKRLLVEAEIFEHDELAVARAEARIANVELDYTAAVREYEGIPYFRGEQAPWQRLKKQIAALQAPTSKALELSRKNDDFEARAELMRLEPQFTEIEQGMDGLVLIDDAGASMAARRIRRLQRSSTWLFVGWSLVGATLTLVVGVSAARMAGRRDEALGQYMAALEAKNRDLDAFAGRAAHDIRGPLSAISMGCQLLLRKAPELSSTVASIEHAIARMEALTEDLLSLARLDAPGQGGLGDPALLAAEVRELLAQRLEAEGMTLRLAVEPATVQGAGGLLRQALLNLADNAIKYRRTDGQAYVEIHGRVVGKQYELRVSDNGVGMSYGGRSSRLRAVLSVAARAGETRDGARAGDRQTRGRGERWNAVGRLQAGRGDDVRDPPSAGLVGTSLELVWAAWGVAAVAVARVARLH